MHLFFIKHIFIFALILSSLFSFESCNSTGTKTTILKNRIKYTNLQGIHFDSFFLDSFPVRFLLKDKYLDKLHAFYSERKFTYAWLYKGEFNAYAKQFIQLLEKDSTLTDANSKHYRTLIHYPSYLSLKKGERNYLSKKQYADIEMLLTIIFFEYATRNWEGLSEKERKVIGWNIHFEKLDYSTLLSFILAKNPEFLSTYQPIHPQYRLLAKQLAYYQSIVLKTEWNTLFPEGMKLNLGDTSNQVLALKNHLYLEQDLVDNNHTNQFDTAVFVALKKYQQRHGLFADGILGKQTIGVLGVSIQSLIKTIKLNMLRCKMVPAVQKGDFIVVNIPAFKLYFYHNEQLLWSSKVVVGKISHLKNTMVFNDVLDQVVFSPYWNLPQGIITKQVLPQLKQNPNYLAEHEMEVVTNKGEIVPSNQINWDRYTTHFPFEIRQKPGKNNALGLVKFLFPNKYAIYIHDTPEKSLFGETKRTFSQGCIRLQNPMKLAQIVLRNRPSYTEKRIQTLMQGGVETYVHIKPTIPVFIVYFTAWVDGKGKLNVRNDVYQQDMKMNKYSL